jgi:hypothetical protein
MGTKTHMQQITMADLVDGDRFYFKSDKKRISQQFVKRNRKTVSYIDSAIAERGHDKEKLIKWASETAYNREIFFLRNVSQQHAKH